MLENEQQRLNTLLQQQTHTPEPPPRPESPVNVRHAELVKPAAIREDKFDRLKPSKPQNGDMGVPRAYNNGGRERAGNAEHDVAEGFASRLRALDGIVMENRLSLAETEKNVLR